MKAVISDIDYKIIATSISNVLDKSKKLPGMVFNTEFKYFLFITFDDLFLELFFNNIKSYLIELNEKLFFIAVTDPDPYKYFAHHFDFYGAVEYSSIDSDEDYIYSLNNFPVNSPADAVIHNSNSLIVSSYSSKWVVFGDRVSDVAICAFSDLDNMKIFKNIYNSDLLSGVEDAAKYAYGESGNIPQRDEFYKNYSSI